MLSDENGLLHCPYCDQIIDTDSQCLEHIQNIKNGGATIRGNILIVCRRCNGFKEDQIFELWYRKQNFFSHERLKWIRAYRNFPGSFIKDNIIYLELLTKKYFSIRYQNRKFIGCDRKRAAKEIGVHYETVSRGLRGESIRCFEEIRYLNEDEVIEHLKKQGYEVRNVPKNLLEVIED